MTFLRQHAQLLLVFSSLFECPSGSTTPLKTIQRLIDRVLRGLPFCYAYIDDLLVASASPDEHKHHLQLVLQRLSNHCFIINSSKCKLGVAELDFWGTVSAQMVSSHCRIGFEPLISLLSAG